MESMTQAPYLLPKARQGYRYGNAELVDATFHDGLFDAFDREAMGESTEKHNDAYGFTREQQDEYAARSARAAAAGDQGRPLRRRDRRRAGAPAQGRAGAAQRGRGRAPRHHGRVASAACKPAFRKDGTITAGNASQISDGAAAVVVMSRAKAEQLGVADRVLAEIGAHGVVAGPDNSLQLQPANAIRAALAKSDVALEDLQAIEINEAFAAVGLASQRDLGLGNDVFNPNGGAIALGHPIGASGARLALTLVHELRRRGGGAGAAALCGGGGQGDALLFHV